MMLDEKKYIAGNRKFREGYFKQNALMMEELSQGQNPQALFIGCADSRVLPALIIQSDPGDLFVIRNVGNFVAPYKVDEDFHATAAGIEYAVNVLGVQEIIICGHTHCGACAALYTNSKNPELIHTNTWLKLGEPAKDQAIAQLGSDADKAQLLRLTERLSAVLQAEHMLTYPFVKKKIEDGSLILRTWIYHLETGSIDQYDPDTKEFIPLS